MLKMRNLLKSEFIGKNMMVVSSKDKQNIGIEFVVLDEGLNTFKVFDGETTRTLMKNNITFKINDSEPIEGSKVQIRPEDRIKRVKTNG